MVPVGHVPMDFKKNPKTRLGDIDKLFQRLVNLEILIDEKKFRRVIHT